MKGAMGLVIKTKHKKSRATNGTALTLIHKTRLG